MLSSADRRANPERWPSRLWGVRHFLSLAVLTFLAVVAGLFCAVAASDDAWRTASIAALMCAFFLLVAVHGALVWLFPRHARRDVVLGEHRGCRALTVRESGPLFAVLVVLMACVTLMLGLGTVWSIQFREGTGVLRSVALAMATAFFGSFLVAVLSGRVTRGFLALTPSGIYQRGRSLESYLPWESIMGATAIYNGISPQIFVVGRADVSSDRRQTARFWRLDRLPRDSMIVIDCLTFGIDRNLLHEIVTYYVDHPEAREELGTERDLARVASWQTPPR
jgi:hypothetical protein